MIRRQAKKLKRITEPGPKAPAGHALLTAAVPIDEHCTGDRWIVQDEARLARLIAVIAMGQADYAAHVVTGLLPATPAFTNADLLREAKVLLSVQNDKTKPRQGYPQWQRDGFIFEAISWIAARQSNSERALLKPPHTSATTQGLDGLMLELSDDRTQVIMTTIFEDKCTDDPRPVFLKSVLPAFFERHQNKRSVEMVAAAAALLRMAGIAATDAARLSAAVMDRDQRSYRAAFALTTAHDSQKARRALFRGFDTLDGVPPGRRIGAGLIVTGALRTWVSALASQSVAYLDELQEIEN